MDYQSIVSGSTVLRGFSLVAKASGSPITAGTVNYYLKALTGANAGKWWRTSDGTWQASETANAMTHQNDGHWTRDAVVSSVSPFSDSVVYLEYAKESGDLHVPVSRILAGDDAIDRIRRSAKSMIVGTVDAGATTTVIPIKTLGITHTTDNQFRNRLLIFQSDTTTADLQGQISRISSGSVSSGTLTVSPAFSTAPAEDDAFFIA